MINSLFKRKSVRTAFLIVMVLLAVVSLLQGIKNAYLVSQDFQWDAAKVFSMRINPYDESVSMNPSGILDQYGFDEYYLQMEANQFPSLLCILLPFTLLGPLTARYVWIACNMIFTIGIIVLLKKTFLKEMDDYWFYALSLLMIAGTPYRNQVGVGQHTLFAFCFFLIAVYFSEYREKRNIVITVCALFVSFFKYTLTAPLVLYFVYKKRYKEIIIPVVMHGVLTVISAFWLKDSFLNMIIKPLKVSSALSAEGGLDISALLGGSPLAYVFAVLIMAALFIICIKMPQGYDRVVMSLLTLWSLIITYHRTYDFFVMIVVAALFIELAQKNEKSEDITFSEKFLNNLNVYYIVTMVAVFFVLRIFSEALPSKIFVGGLYYILTAAVSYISVLICKTQKLQK